VQEIRLNVDESVKAKHGGVETASIRRYTAGNSWCVGGKHLGMFTDTGKRPRGGQSSAVSETLGVTRRPGRRTPLEYGPTLLRNLARCSSV
jgi:hypothetical protein